MTKKDMINVVAEETGLTKVDAGKALDAFYGAVATALKKGEKVQLLGFGTFEVSERAERTGLNPRTKEKLVIPSSKSVKFRVSKPLKEIING